MKKYYPLFIPTLCRYKHLKRCIESLSNCYRADEIDCYIALDYPLKESHKEGYNQICNYLENANLSFHKTVIVKREKNYGAIRNYSEMKNYIQRNYDEYIFSEDDNEFSPAFLDYIISGLEIYKDNPSVIAISGFSLPSYHKYVKDSTFFMHGFNAWGYATWNRKEQELLNHGDSYYQNILSSPSLLFKLFVKSPISVGALAEMYLKKQSWTDYKWSIYAMMENKLQLRPAVSLVRNWGFDGSGEHCGNNCGIEKYPISPSTKFDMNPSIPICANAKIVKLSKYDCFSHRPLSFMKQLVKIIIYPLAWNIKNITNKNKL